MMDVQLEEPAARVNLEDLRLSAVHAPPKQAPADSGIDLVRRNVVLVHVDDHDEPHCRPWGAPRSSARAKMTLHGCE
jgi:hypothetical protein